MGDSNKHEMEGLNLPFTSVSESKILRIHEDAVPENAKKATKFGIDESFQRIE